jgi:hypothetical protein
MMRLRLPLPLQLMQGEAFGEDLLRHGDDEDARRQSQRLVDLEPANWSEQVPDWRDWTA